MESLKTFFQKGFIDLYDLHERNLNFKRPNLIVEEFCSEYNITYISMLESFKNHSSFKSDLYFENDPHTNNKGNILMAEVISEEMLRKNLID